MGLKWHRPLAVAFFFCFCCFLGAEKWLSVACILIIKYSFLYVLEPTNYFIVTSLNPPDIILIAWELIMCSLTLTSTLHRVLYYIFLFNVDYFRLVISEHMRSHSPVENVTL